MDCSAAGSVGDGVRLKKAAAQAREGQGAHGEWSQVHWTITYGENDQQLPPYHLFAALNSSSRFSQ
jgi:hypothetical protein